MVRLVALLLLILACTASAQMWGRFPRNGCVGAWSFEDGKVIDAISTNNGVLIGSPGFVSSPLGYALSTSPSSNAVKVGFPWGSGVTGPKSAAIWFYPTNVGVGYLVGNITQSSPGFRFITQTNTFQCSWDAAATSTIFSNTITLFQWHFVAAMLSGTTATVYFDGQSLGSKSLVAEVAPSANAVRLGARPDSNGGVGATVVFQGFIDSAILFNRYLTLPELNAIYYSRRPIQ